MTLCDTFKRLSLETWDELQRSRTVCFQLKEETLTDKNMLELKVRHPGQIKTTVFTKHLEGINGADWEWWFRGLSNKWIGFRVQAKIINIKSNEFEHLHYRNRKSGEYQADKLITRALTSSTPKIPLYCFFLQTNDLTQLNKWNCQTFGKMKDFYGCSLTSAFTVRQLRTGNKRHLKDLENHLEPWHCLICCRGYRQQDFVSNIQKYAINNFYFGNEIENNLDIPDNFITDNPPEYVLRLWNNEAPDNMAPPDEDLYGITIIMEDKEK